MSEKKSLKQMRLPFQLISTSPKAATHSPTIAIPEKSSPKTPATTSRKRRPSSDGENVRQTKIGRTNSKENISEIIAEHSIEIVDSDEDEKKTTTKEKKSNEIVETTPTLVTPVTENIVHIKLPSSSKSKRKINMDVKPQKSIEEEEEDPDDSIVYLDKEELPKHSKKSKRSAKKSEKKKKQSIIKNEMNHVKKTLKLNELVEDQQTEEEQEVAMEIVKIDDTDEDDSINDDDNAGNKNESNENERESNIIAEKSKGIVEESFESPPISSEISKLINGNNSNSSLSPTEDQIMDMLSDEPGKASPLNESNTIKGIRTTPKLTPKAMERRKEQEAKRIEKEHQRQKERDEKEKQRLKEKEMREEAKKKEKEDKEEMRKREKEERDKKRQAELDKKKEEMRLKEEERKRLADQKEEEKRLKEEERKQKEDEKKRQTEAREEERKKKEMEKSKEEDRKKRAAEAFTKFFKKKHEQSMVLEQDETSKESAESSETTSAGNFMPFQIHGKMRLAPCVRLEISKKQLDTLDEYLKKDVESSRDNLYIKQLLSGKHIPKSSTKTWPQEEEDKDDDLMVIDEFEGVGEDIKEDEAHLKMKHRAKLLLFIENRRPAYYGTWRKKSSNITARRPFYQDTKFFDYEVESDDEWEEEEPGESLHGSDSEKEKDVEEEDYEVDNDFFVPHGHLSEEEMQQMDDEVMEDNSPETQKAKLKILQQEFAAEMKKKTEKIKPRLIGCIWMNGDEDKDGGSINGDSEKKYHCSDIIWRILKAREMMSSGEEIKMVEEFEPEIIETEEEPAEKIVVAQKTPLPKIRPKIDADSVKSLIKLVHGNINNRKFLIREFQAYRLKNFYNQPDFQEFSVRSVEEKMLEISDYKSCPEEGPLFGKKCWYVKPDVVKEHFGDEKLSLPNQWTYVLDIELSRKKKVKQNNQNGEGEKKNSREASPEDEEMETEESQVKLNFPKPQSPKLNAGTLKQFKDKTQSPKPSIFSLQKSSPKSTTQINVAQSSGKKRVSLVMSVPLGQQINEEKKNNLISQYLKSNQKDSASSESMKKDNTIDNNEIIEIID